MSTIANALKSSREICWIVKAEIGGRNFWWSTKTFSIANSGGDDILVDGILLNNISFQQSVDIRSLSSSLSTIAVTVINRDRMQDYDALICTDNSYVNIYIWCDGLDWTDIEEEGLLMRGLLRYESHDRTTYSFKVEDLMKYQSQTIPAASINTSTWPSHRVFGGGGSVAGKPQQMVFGDWPKGIQLLCVDTTNFLYLVGAHNTVSVTADYTATTVNVYDKDGGVVAAAGFVLTFGNDSSGNLTSYFDFAADKIASEPLTCSIQGMPDDSAGTFTGTASALIENPGDVIHNLFRNHTLVDPDYLDVASFKTCRSAIPAAKVAAVINDQTSVYDIINRICGQFQIFKCLRKSGRVGIKTINLDALDTGNINCKNDAVDGSISFTKTDIESVTNNLVLSYGFNPSSGAFEKALVRNKDNNTLCQRSYYNYGEAPLSTLSLYDVQDDATALLISDRYLNLYSRRRDIINFSCPVYAAWDHELGDIVTVTSEDGPSLDGSGWAARRCIMIGKTYSGNVAKVTLMDTEN